MKTTREFKLPDIVPADISGALDELGIDHVIRGDEAVSTCPSPDHPDNTPSWSINLDTGKHHCFSCGFGGSFQWLVQIVQGTRSGEAIAWIKTRKMSLAVERPVNPEPTVHESDLYFATDPPYWALNDRNVFAQACFNAEVLFDEKNDEWVFPLRDPWTDKLIGWQTKGAHPETKDIVKNYPQRVRKASTVFGYKYLKATGTSKTIVMVENPIKVPRVIDAGFRSGAFLGASFTDYQVNDLLWHLTDRVVLFLDNDRAGQQRVARFIAENPYARPSTYVFNYGTVVKRNGAYVHARGDDRDPGDLTAQEIRTGILNATPASFTYFEGIDWT